MSIQKCPRSVKAEFNIRSDFSKTTMIVPTVALAFSLQLGLCSDICHASVINDKKYLTDTSLVKKKWLQPQPDHIDLLNKNLLHDKSFKDIHTGAGSTIVIIDSGIRDPQLFARQAPANAEIFFVDGSSGGIEQVSEFLRDFNGVAAVHVYSHGGPGYFMLGSDVVQKATIPYYKNAFQDWGKTIAPGGDIIFYGCNVAEGDEGKDFVLELSNVTGADVAASTDPTGHSSLGADWDMEVKAGVIESHPIVIPEFVGKLTVYDFSNLGAASDGLKPQGDQFLVSDKFYNWHSSTYMYWSDNNSETKQITGAVIKADGTNLSSFDLDNMQFSVYQNDTITTMTITGTLAGGSTVSQTINNKAIVLGETYTLTGWGADLSGFNDVTDLQFDATFVTSETNLNFDNIDISDRKTPVVPGVEPTIQVSNLTVSSVGTSTASLHWENGDGSRRIVLVKKGASGSPPVVDGTAYIADNNYSTSTDIGSGWKCVYTGTGNSLIINSLNVSTTYRYVVYEYDGLGGAENYLISSGSNVIDQATVNDFANWTQGTPTDDIPADLVEENFWSWTDAAIDSNNNTYVIHKDQNDTIAIEKWDGSGWSHHSTITPDDIPTITGFSDKLSIAIDGSNNMHIAFVGNKAIVYGINTGSGWTFELAATDADPDNHRGFSHPRIAVDSSGNPHILYQFDDYNSPTTQSTKIQSRTGPNSWSVSKTIETISPTLTSNEIKENYAFDIDANNKFHVFYLRETSKDVRDLHYLTNAGGTWTDTTFINANEEDIDDLALDLDTNNKVHFVYSSDSAGVNYLTNASGDWVYSTLYGSYFPLDIHVRSVDNGMAIPVRGEDEVIGADNFKVLVKDGTNPWYISGPSATVITSDYEGYAGTTYSNNNQIMIAYANALSTRPRLMNYVMATTNFTPPNNPPTFTGTPTITGTAAIGSTLGLVDTGTQDDEGDTVTLSYQWKADNTNIGGATSETYILTQNEAHKSITCTLTADDGNGASTDNTTSGVTVINNPPSFTGTPAIDGSGAVGDTLSLTGTGTSDADGDTVTFSYQWLAEGSNITGATSSTYQLTANEAHKTITCTISGSDGHGGSTGSVTTSGVSVENSSPSFIGTPAIDGGGSVGDTLSLTDTGTSDADGDTVTLAYQWKANGTDITGATSPTYQLTVNEAHKSITCLVTASDPYTSTSTTTGGVTVTNSAPSFTGTPAINGSGAVGDTLSLTGTGATDADIDPVTLGYQWKADGTNITGATSSTYQLTINEAHKSITCLITASDPETSTSTTTGGVTVTNSAPSFTGTPAINGSGAVGDTLSLTGTGTSDADGDPVTLAYQWKADGADISGATSSTYQLTANEAHKTITCIISGSDGQGGSTGSVTTSGVSVENSAPSFTGTTAISGSGAVGDTLSLTGTGTSDADGDTVTLGYQWKADGADISGATSATYQLTANEAHKSITCLVTASDPYTSTSTTTAGVTVTNSAPSFTGTPAINGSGSVGDTLSLTNTGTTDADIDPVTLSYQWKVNGTNISGATSTTYQLTANEAHETITCAISGVDGHGGSTGMVTTAGVTVENSAPVFLGTPSIDGKVENGQKLILLDTSTEDKDGDSVTITYQWHADGVDISGATSDTFTVTSSEDGKTITCTLTVTDGYGGTGGPFTTEGLSGFPWHIFMPAIY